MTSPEQFSRLQSAMSQAVKAHWKAFLFEGILLAVLGIAALILPPLASLAITIFLGWMFLVSGIGGLFVTLKIAVPSSTSRPWTRRAGTSTASAVTPKACW